MLTKGRRKTESLQNDFISSGVWPNQTVTALMYLSLPHLGSLLKPRHYWWERSTLIACGFWMCQKFPCHPYNPHPLLSWKSCTCGSEAFLFALDNHVPRLTPQNTHKEKATARLSSAQIVSLYLFGLEPELNAESAILFWLFSLLPFLQVDAALTAKIHPSPPPLTAKQSLYDPNWKIQASFFKNNRGGAG